MSCERTRVYLLTQETDRHTSPEVIEILAEFRQKPSKPKCGISGRLSQQRGSTWAYTLNHCIELVPLACTHFHGAQFIIVSLKERLFTCGA
jgi:hypothetical protein